MKYHSKNNLFKKGFSLMESVAAIGVLAIIASSSMLIIDRCMNSAMDIQLRRNAFEVVRENMELTLAQDTACEMSEFGISEIYPDIQWQTKIEMFTPANSENKWLKAICSAQYYDTSDRIQDIEFSTWLTKLSKRDILKIKKQRSLKDELEGIGLEASPVAYTTDGTKVYVNEDGELVIPRSPGDTDPEDMTPLDTEDYPVIITTDGKKVELSKGKGPIVASVSAGGSYSIPTADGGEVTTDPVTPDPAQPSDTDTGSDTNTKPKMPREFWEMLPEDMKQYIDPI